ncbi:class I heat shock protein-like [Quillaja saponaria]|uniref:Class I heat shock protein-like n=1 Tax=Quillaja saponaria TaxID=32244 RepID=A0AAD7VGD9_QUISA|nr:class I heat shock protein-like [Quillaja saponaria]
MSQNSKFLDNEIFDPFLSLINKCPVLNTPTDWKETPDAHIFIADLPGLKKDEVNVQVDEGRVLQISGERSGVDEGDDHDKNNVKWHRVERCRGKFHRRFRLPENAKVDQVKASMENGVLVVTVPKQEVKKPEKKVIQIEGN